MSFVDRPLAQVAAVASIVVSKAPSAHCRPLNPIANLHMLIPCVYFRGPSKVCTVGRGEDHDLLPISSPQCPQGLVAMPTSGRPIPCLVGDGVAHCRETQAALRG